MTGKEYLLQYWKAKAKIERLEMQVESIDLSLLQSGMLHARVEVGNLTQYSASGTQNTLEKLLEGGHITLRQYLEQLPEGILPMRDKLLGEIQNSQKEKGGDEVDAGADHDRAGRAADA